MSNEGVTIIEAPGPRRTFLQAGAALLGGVFLPSAMAAAAKSCRPTAQDIIGPFYRFGAPLQSKLLGADEPGERLVVAGTVYGSDCRTRLPNALIEVWQANHAGLYDTDKPGNFTERHAFRLRGMMLTDQQGHYELETIMPGRYPIPPNLPGLEKYAGLTRPAHIHFKVSEPLHVPLTAQLYFKDDPYIRKDPWARDKPSLTIGLKQEGKFLRGTFDMVLAKGF